MRVELVNWDLDAGGVGPHRPQAGPLIDGVFYRLPHRSQLHARNDLREALELIGVDFDEGRPDALERQIEAATRKVEEAERLFERRRSGDLPQLDHLSDECFERKLEAAESWLAKLERSRDA